MSTDIDAITQLDTAQLVELPVHYGSVMRGGSLDHDTVPAWADPTYLQPGYVFQCAEPILATPARGRRHAGNTLYVIFSIRGRHLRVHEDPDQDEPVAFLPDTWFAVAIRHQRSDGLNVVVLKDCGSPLDRYAQAPWQLGHLEDICLEPTANVVATSYAAAPDDLYVEQPTSYSGPFAPLPGHPSTLDPHRLTAQVDYATALHRRHEAINRVRAVLRIHRFLSWPEHLVAEPYRVGHRVTAAPPDPMQPRHMVVGEAVVTYFAHETPDDDAYNRAALADAELPDDES